MHRLTSGLYVIWVLCLILALGQCEVKTQKVKAKKGDNATLWCDNRNATQGAIGVVRAWFLPDGRALARNHWDNDRRLLDNGRRLVILSLRADGKDEGKYLCIISVTFEGNPEPQAVAYIRVELVRTYASMFEEYRNNFIIAACVAGSFIVLVLGGCLVWQCRWREKGIGDSSSQEGEGQAKSDGVVQVKRINGSTSPHSVKRADYDNSAYESMEYNALRPSQLQEHPSFNMYQQIIATTRTDGVLRVSHSAPQGSRSPRGSQIMESSTSGGRRKKGSFTTGSAPYGGGRARSGSDFEAASYL